MCLINSILPKKRTSVRFFNTFFGLFMRKFEGVLQWTLRAGHRFKRELAHTHSRVERYGHPVYIGDL
jgi:hypothetical protein